MCRKWRRKTRQFHAPEIAVWRRKMRRIFSLFSDRDSWISDANASKIYRRTFFMRRKVLFEGNFSDTVCFVGKCVGKLISDVILGFTDIFFCVGNLCFSCNVILEPTVEVEDNVINLISNKKKEE